MLLLLLLLLLLLSDVCQATVAPETCAAEGDEGCRDRRPVATPCSVLPLPAVGDSPAPVAVRAQPVHDDGGTGTGRELEYYLLGSPVAHSPSPLLHNAGFAACGLRHVYQARETPSVQEATAVLRNSPRFGGASVTIPLKEAIIPSLDRLGGEAAAIGAVNTVVRTSAGELVGENTDYLGILYPVKAALQRRRSRQEPVDREKMGIALVVGAGGTARAAAFAARELGLGVFIWNRSRDKASKLAADFKGTHIPSPGVFCIARPLEPVLIVATCCVGCNSLILLRDGSPWIRPGCRIDGRGR
jgi:shikimate 5-dehydrogenase